MPSHSPIKTDYRGVPFDPEHRDGVAYLLSRRKRVIRPMEDVKPDIYTQRDINEMLSRGWVRRHKQRSIDKAWWYIITDAGRAAAGEYL